MSNPISNYYAETSINGEVIGEQEISLFPLVNSVLTSEPLIFNVGKLPIPISKSYQLVYDNEELGPVIDTSRYSRNEILSLNVAFVSQSAASIYSSSYQLVYDNEELGPVIDKSRYYRNEILTLKNQDAYRYLVQDGTGSNYPIDGRYDQYYRDTKVILNFDSLTNQAFTNLSILSSGSFQINEGPTLNTSSFISNSIQVLVVAGGGGGGMDMGGGGGGGGVIYNNSYTITSGSVINVTVGNGGSGAPAAGTSGQPGSHQYTISATQGGNSVFGSITAIGGGYGGSSYFQYTPNNGYGGSGGSGGGASGYSDGNTGRNGTGSAGQGFNGGGSSGQYYSGGGGGAGGVGSSGPNKANGGPGVIYPTISPYYFGGGGGGSGYSINGGDGGIGGGGGGAVGTTVGGTGLNNGSAGGGGSTSSQTNTPGGNAGANTGGGGGGGSHYNSNNRGGNGGSGIVIVRYYGSQKATGGTVTSVNGNTIHTLTGSATMSFYDTPITNPTSVGFFDGSGSFLRVTESSLLNLGSGSLFTSPFTVEYDFYTNSSSKYQTILSRGAGSINYNTASGLVYNSGISSSKVIWEYYTNNTSSYLLTGSTNIIDNNWYSYAVTYDGNITRLYLNGILENYVCGSVYNYPSTLLSSLTSSFIGRLVNTGSNDFSGYLDKFRITTGIARYTTLNYSTQTSNYQTATGFLSGSNYCNSNILNIRFVSSSISTSNLILPSGTTDLTSSQDIVVTNITKNVNNYLINTISTGSNLIKRNDGIVDKTVYTGDLYLSSTDIVTVGSINNLINNLNSGSNLIRRSDGITNKIFYNGDLYLSQTTIETKGLIERIILRGSDTSITVNSSEFIPTTNKTINFEADYNYMFDTEIDSIYTIDSAFGLPTGFTTRERNIVGYVNFTTPKTIVVKLSDNTYYNVIIKPIFTKKKYIY
jgi:hypothetical protein